MPQSFDCDVLIVGAGPVGVTLALLLAQQGVSVIATDKAPDIYPLPRAAHIDHEIVRVFQGLGIADEIMAGCRVADRYDFLTAGGEVLLRFETKGERSPSGWPASNMIHQPSIEAALRCQLARSPKADLRVNWTFDGLTTDDEGVSATFSAPEGPRTLRARYLIGCDGASSSVREACGVKFQDLEFDEPWLVVDALVHDASRLPTANLQICDPARPTTCVLMGEGRHRWEFMLKPGETAEAVTEDAFIWALLEPWKVNGAVSLERRAVYRFHALVAERWRIGRVTLAGDAAHQMPPFAGQGLCSGIRDAANLAWKLIAILAGRAGDELLDTYQPEREANVRAIIDMALLMGRTVCITDPMAAAERDRQMLARRKAGGGGDGGPGYPPITAGCILAGTPGAGEIFPQPWPKGPGEMRLDDVLGAGAWLVSRTDQTSDPSTFAASLSDSRMDPFRPDIEGWMNRRGAEAVLVRPDRYVFGTGDPATLQAAWTRAQA